MEGMRQQVVTMQRKIHDLLDAPNDGAARSLVNEVQGLEDDLQVAKNARTWKAALSGLSSCSRVMRGVRRL